MKIKIQEPVVQGDYAVGNFNPKISELQVLLGRPVLLPLLIRKDEVVMMVENLSSSMPGDDNNEIN